MALENSIEGTVNVTLDHLIFAHELWIVRELQLEVAQCLVGLAGARFELVKKVVSMPVATAQCRGWLSRHLAGAEEEASPSTADAVRRVAEAQDPHVAAIGTRRAAAIYGLEVLASGIEDNNANTTRFVVVARPEWVSRRRRDTTRRASCVSSPRTARAACTPSSASSRRGTLT